MVVVGGLFTCFSAAFGGRLLASYSGRDWGTRTASDEGCARGPTHPPRLYSPDDRCRPPPREEALQRRSFFFFFSFRERRGEEGNDNQPIFLRVVARGAGIDDSEFSIIHGFSEKYWFRGGGQFESRFASIEKYFFYCEINKISLRRIKICNGVK